MNLLAASVAGLAMIASPVLAQPADTGAAQTNVKATTTTKDVHATNVPVRKHHRTHHHMVRCSCPPSHMKGHHAKTHNVVKKTTTTTTKS